MPLFLFPSMRVVPKSTREWDEFFRTLRVVPDDGSVGEDQVADDVALVADITAAVAAHTASTDNTTAAELATAISTHEAAGNPHPTYLTQAEGDALYQPLAAVLSMLHTGTGDPEGVLTAPVGHLFLRSDGGALTTLYVKESGAGNTGWVPK